MSEEMGLVGDDTPAWVKSAAAASGVGQPPKALSDIVGGGEAFHTGTFGDDESFAEDVTPPASNAITTSSRDGLTPFPKASVRGDIDQQTQILENLFPNGIPVNDIKKALFVSNIVDELILYAGGDLSALERIGEFVGEQK